MEAFNARQRWELENQVEIASSSDLDSLYKWDGEQQKVIQQVKPWTKDTHYFKR
jgi:hypothetical protein